MKAKVQHMKCPKALEVFSPSCFMRSFCADEDSITLARQLSLSLQQQKWTPGGLRQAPPVDAAISGGSQSVRINSPRQATVQFITGLVWPFSAQERFTMRLKGPVKGVGRVIAKNQMFKTHQTRKKNLRNIRSYVDNTVFLARCRIIGGSWSTLIHL